jgi:tripartite-type tricarboxylate transporter receptor subunit TctC
MSTTVWFVRLVSALGAVLAAGLPYSAAAEYPEKPVRLVVPWPAGGGSDVVARVIAQPLGEALKQAVYVENRPGANGAIGSDVVARAPKDGYTLVWVTADTHAINPHVYPKLTYDPRRDFAAVGIAGYFPYALIVNPNFPASNVAEFVAQAKRNPGKVTFASWGIGGSAHVAMEMFKQQAGFDVLHVPFQGAAPAIQAVVGGQVDSMIVPISVAGPHARGGRVKMLGLAASKRFVGAPELKTMAEQGVPVDAGTWVGIMAPAGTPREILTRLNQALNAVVESPAVRESLLKLNTEPSTMSVEQFKAFIDSENERWGKTIRAANIRAES